MRKKKNLIKLLNQNFLEYSNKTIKLGKYDMPYVTCNILPEIDFIATYSQPSTYFYTDNTCVGFFEYDDKFDGFFGLWNAIYYDLEQLKKDYLERFKNVKYFISPDYSKCGDSLEAENIYRQMRARIVSIWLTMNTDAVVIPLVSCANENGMEYMLEGMKDCRVVAFNAKGPMGDPVQKEIFVKSIRKTVDELKKLELIIVNAASVNDDKILELFRYAIENNIKVHIPDNMLRIRNRLKRGGEINGSNS